MPAGRTKGPLTMATTRIHRPCEYYDDGPFNTFLKQKIFIEMGTRFAYTYNNVNMNAWVLVLNVSFKRYGYA